MKLIVIRQSLHVVGADFRDAARPERVLRERKALRECLLLRVEAGMPSLPPWPSPFVWTRSHPERLLPSRLVSVAPCLAVRSAASLLAGLPWLLARLFDVVLGDPPGPPRPSVPRASTCEAMAKYLRKILSANSMGDLRLSKEYAEEPWASARS